MRVMSREEIVAATGISTREVPLPEFGVDVGVLVRSMTLTERNEFLRRANSAEEKEGLAKWIASTLIVDANGDRVMTEDEARSFDGKNWHVLERIVQVIMEMNGMNEAAVEAARGN